MANMRILLWNSNGLLSRKLELDAFLPQEKIDVAMITETHCTSTYYFSTTREYKVFHAFHPTGKAQGGACIYVKHALPFTPDITVSTPLAQLCAIRIPLEGLQLNLASVYCSPSNKMDAADFDTLFQLLEGTWIMGGDYNAKHPTWGSRTTTTRGRELAKSITRRGCEALSSGEPTYWPSHRNRTPDVIDFFVSHGVNRSQCRVNTLADLSSDHVPVILTFSSRPLPLQKDPPLVNRYTDWDKFREIVTEHSRHSVAISTTDALEENVHQFTRIIQQAAEQSTPPLPPPTSTARLPLHCQALLRNRRAARKR